MKKILSLLVVSFLLVLVTGCFGIGEGKTIGFSVSTLNNPFFVTMRDGIQEKASELGYNVSVMDAQDDSATQISQIEDLIAKGVDVILINPVDSATIGTAIAKANEANIPVITIDRSAASGTVATHIASDNVAGGKMAGEYLVQLVGAGAKVVELEGVPGASATIDRGAGFHQAVDSVLTVVAKQTANFNRAEGESVMTNLLQANPTIKGVFAHNDEMALGAIAALKAAGRTDIKVIGFDATDDAKAAVTAGDMAATIEQQPKLMGTLGVEYADKILPGQTVDAYIPVPLSLVK